ncbi:MAG: CpaF family protein [Chloroflexia bacterium]|nr:CpaF family protein [Chloroflexia bacterium]
MVLRDRGVLSRRLGNKNGTAVAERPPSGLRPLPTPETSIAVAPPPEKELVADRPRVSLSREAIELKHRIHDRLLRELDPSRLSADLEPDEARRAVEDAVALLISQEGTNVSRADELIIMREVADEIIGYGPIEPLLNDDSVTEVMINSADRVFYEKAGTVHLSERTFRDDDHVLRLIDKIVSPLGRRIDESSPMVDARLPDGSRVNAIIPPLAIHGPSVTIRKFSKKPYTDQDLIRFGTLSPGMVEMLRACVASRLNILVSGGTGTGKTTFLNVLSSYINNGERIVSIEDPAELQLHQDNWVSLETRPANIEGRGLVHQRDLVRNALRMRPDRIIVGECRAGEAFDMLQAMNTGHDGSLTTVHANTPRDALSRIENMVLMANLDLPVKAIRDQVSSAINVVVQLQRLMDGTRRVTHLTEIVGMEGDVITMHDIFMFEQRGVDSEGKIIGDIQPSGIRPVFADRLERHGYYLPPEIFRTGYGAI